MKSLLTQKFFRVFFSTIVIAMLLALPGIAQAKGPLYEHSTAAKITHKFMRGVGNITFGWVEIPWTINEQVQSLDPLSGTITGTAKGTFRAVRRTAIGCWEVVTFPIPVPREYARIVRPEFVTQESH